jgi:hypothetical protein
MRCEARRGGWRDRGRVGRRSSNGNAAPERGDGAGDRAQPRPAVKARGRSRMTRKRNRDAVQAERSGAGLTRP